MRGIDFMTGIKPFREMTADQLMEKDLIYFYKETTCELLLLSMIDGGLGSVPIIDEEKRLIGIVTQHTLLNAILSGEKIHLLEAGAIMGPARFISSDCLAFKIGPIFQETGLSSISVVDHESRLVGIITEGDLLIGYVEEALDLSPHLKK